MKYNKIIIKFLLLLSFILLYQFNALADNRVCQHNVTDFIDKNHDSDHYEYTESRNDVGIFYEFNWNENTKEIEINRDSRKFPIVKFSFFENDKIIAGKTSIKSFNSINLSKLNDDQIKELSKKNGIVNIVTGNGEKVKIISKPYKLNNFKLSDFKIISIQNIDTKKGILEMSFDAKITNQRNDILNTFKNEIYLLNNKGLIPICDELKDFFYWPVTTVELDEFRYDADVREGFKNKEKLFNSIFDLTYDDNEIRTIRTEKGVGFFRQSFDFEKFPFDTQKLIISIFTGATNFQNENHYYPDHGTLTFLIPGKGAFQNLNKFTDKKINKLKAWRIPENGITIKNRSTYEKDYYDIYSKKTIPMVSRNFLDIEITIKRNPQHYVYKVMLPVFLILCVAWYVLWIPTHKYEARLNTSIIAFLALIAYNFVFQDDIPKLEYLTDLDKFVLLSYVFCCIPVFSSIAFSRFISKNQKKVDKINKLIKIWGGILYCFISIQIFFYK